MKKCSEKFNILLLCSCVALKLILMQLDLKLGDKKPY